MTAVVGVAACLGLSTGCPDSEPALNYQVDLAATAAAGDLGLVDATAARPQFIDVTFAELYQIFMNQGLSDGEKAQRWSRHYRGRWIRWTGQLAYIHTSTLLFRQFGSSTTQDVFLFAPEQRRKNPPTTSGRFYNYVGRLTRYDPMFRTFYLDQGSILGPDEFGVPGVPAEQPTMTRRLPGPPSPLPWPAALPVPAATNPELALPDGSAVPSQPVPSESQPAK